MSRTYTSNPSLCQNALQNHLSLPDRCLFYISACTRFENQEHALLLYQVWQQPLVLSAPQNQRRKQAMTKTSWSVFLILCILIVVLFFTRQNASKPLKVRSSSSSGLLCNTSSWQPTSHRSLFLIKYSIVFHNSFSPPRTR